MTDWKEGVEFAYWADHHLSKQTMQQCWPKDHDKMYRTFKEAFSTLHFILKCLDSEQQTHLYRFYLKCNMYTSATLSHTFCNAYDCMTAIEPTMNSGTCTYCELPLCHDCVAMAQTRCEHCRHCKRVKIQSE